MTQFSMDAIDAILLDIEGTTTPIDFVFGVLFPFAKEHVASFLETHQADESVKVDLSLLRQEYETDVAHGFRGIDWKDSEVAGAVSYIHHLIDIDRKSTGLKSLQGKVWNQGYLDGTLRSPLFVDVKPAFEQWTAAGKQLFIFSSGSVQAQKLLFRYTRQGDLTSFISGYFDTQTGSKREPASYEAIAAAIGYSAQAILFISDVTAELRAAEAIGMQTLFSVRPGNHSSDSEGFQAIESFDQI